MVSQESIHAQDQIVGGQVRQARIYAQKSVQQCAQAIDRNPEFIVRVEDGQEGLTLPQVEVLAHFLQVPLAYLLGEGELPEDKAQEPPSYVAIMTVRRKIIGLILRKARQESGRALEEIAEIVGYAPEHMAQVELGERELTLAELMTVIEALGVSFERLIIRESMPVAYTEGDTRDSEQLAHLSPGIQDFVLRPINMPYLQIAMNLSQMPSETLHQIASGLLEITY